MTEKAIRILIVEDSEDDEILIKRFACKNQKLSGWKRVDSEAGMRQALETEKWDIIISDFRLPHFSGPVAIQTLQSFDLDIPLIIVSGTIGEEFAVEMLKTGATDYILKSNLGRLPSAIERALREHRNIVERKKALHDLFHEHQYLSVILKSLPIIVYSCTVDTRKIKYVGPQVESITGFSPDHFLDDPKFWSAHLHPEDYPQVMDQLKHISKTRKCTLNYRFRVSDGSYRYFLDSVLLAQFPNDQVETMVGAWMDNNDQVLAESAHRSTKQELIEAQKMDTVGRLAGGVAHDVNNVLAAITLFSELADYQIQNNNLAGARKSIEGILNAQESAASIVRQLLMYSRRRLGPPQIVDLASVISGTQTLLQRLAGENIQFEIKNQSAIPLLVTADKTQLEQVLLNLVVNARDAMTGAGKLSLVLNSAIIRGNLPDARSSIQPGRFAVITVSDTGPGMTADTLKNLFEPFFTTKDPGKGTGLGLSVVFTIIKQANGTIVVDSVPGKGTSFHVYWPLMSEATFLVVNALLEPEEKTLPIGSGTLLLVEDEDSLREILELTLQKEGYTVLKASNGIEALKILKVQGDTISLIITDVMMPEMSGPELAKKAKATCPDTPVLFLSGYSDGILKIHDFDSQSMSFLEKPFSSTTLLKKVTEIINSNQKPNKRSPA